MAHGQPVAREVPRDLLNEADHLIVELPLELREHLPRTSDVRRLLRGLRTVETAEWSDR